MEPVQQQISKLQDKFHGLGTSSGQGYKELTEDDLIDIHHRFCVVYGWISVDEFRKIKLPTLWNLVDKVNEEYREKKEIYHAIMAFVGAKPNKHRR